MTATILTIVGGLLSFAVQLWMDYQKGAPARKAKADAITNRDLDELESGMARVDRMHRSRNKPVPKRSPPRV